MEWRSGLVQGVPAAQRPSNNQSLLSYILSHIVTTWNFFLRPRPREETLLASSGKFAIPASENRSRESIFPEDLDRNCTEGLLMARSCWDFLVDRFEALPAVVQTIFLPEVLRGSHFNVPVARNQNNRFPDIWTWSVFLPRGIRTRLAAGALVSNLIFLGLEDVRTSKATCMRCLGAIALQCHHMRPSKLQGHHKRPSRLHCHHKRPSTLQSHRERPSRLQSPGNTTTFG